jgi:ARG/rhodanese/phosphatase superfamily protein
MRSVARLLPVLLLAMFCLVAVSPRSSGGAVLTKIGGEEYRITGPYSHENVSVYLLHARTQDPRTFLTLDEGLRAKVVKVSEKGDVNELLITNEGEDSVFVQEGDRVEGGNQDRTFESSMVIPPGTKKMPVAAFCVEPDRWEPENAGGEFRPAASAALAPKTVRLAAKYEQNQGRVWEEVADSKTVAIEVAGAPSATSSLNETMDSAPVKNLSEEILAALGALPGTHRNAVGIAVAVNGTIEEANIYPNNRLLVKLYPRVLRSYALQATAQREKGKRTEAAPPIEVARFMREEPQAGQPSARPAASPAPTPQPDDHLLSLTYTGAHQAGRRLMRETRTPLTRAGGRPASAPLGDTRDSAYWYGNTELRSISVRPARTRNSYGTTLASPEIISEEPQPVAPHQDYDREQSLAGEADGSQYRPAGRVERLNGANSLRVQDQKDRVASVTEFGGKVVHRQFMRK